MSKLAFLAAAGLVAAAAPAAAWGPRGHMIVADLAWQKLNPTTRRAVSSLLRHNPLYDQWTHGMAPGAARDEMAFVRAATWPDDIKGGQGYPDYGYRRDDNHEKPPADASAMQNVAYDCIQHRYWHFKDIPFSRDGTALEQPPAANAEAMIGTFAATLADRHASDVLKSYDLTWLIHLAGDSHQPLHATSRFTADGPAADQGADGGGNAVKQAGGHGSLHGFWDGLPGSGASATAAIHAAHSAAWNRAVPAAAAAQLDPKIWFTQSEALAEQHAYIPPVPDNAKGVFSPTPAYRAQALEVAHARIALAGARLANLLNRAHIRVANTPVTDHKCPRTIASGTQGSASGGGR
jgi:hypothetical protein